MAQIDNLFIKATTEEAFDARVEAQEVKDTSIAFIEDSKKIYTHGSKYPSVTWAELTEETS